MSATDRAAMQTRHRTGLILTAEPGLRDGEGIIGPKAEDAGNACQLVSLSEV